MKNRNRAVPAVYLMLLDGGMVLLSLRQNTGYQDGNWTLPSGHVETGELPWKDALIRETEEEIGLRLRVSDLRLAHVMYRTACDETGDRVDFFFTSDWSGARIDNKEPEKCVSLEWYHTDRLPENVTPHVRLAIICIADGIPYSELGVDWFKDRGLYKLDEARA